MFRKLGAIIRAVLMFPVRLGTLLLLAIIWGMGFAMVICAPIVFIGVLAGGEPKEILSELYEGARVHAFIPHKKADPKDSGEESVKKSVGFP